METQNNHPWGEIFKLVACILVSAILMQATVIRLFVRTLHAKILRVKCEIKGGMTACSDINNTHDH